MNKKLFKFIFKGAKNSILLEKEIYIHKDWESIFQVNFYEILKYLQINNLYVKEIIISLNDNKIVVTNIQHYLFEEVFKNVLTFKNIDLDTIFDDVLLPITNVILLLFDNNNNINIKLKLN